MDMIDIRDEPVEIKISKDKKTVWINTSTHCVFRAQNIPKLSLDIPKIINMRIK